MGEPARESGLPVTLIVNVLPSSRAGTLLQGILRGLNAELIHQALLLVRQAVDLLHRALLFGGTGDRNPLHTQGPHEL